MLSKLAEFGRRIRKEDACDALKQEMVSVDILIDEQGGFNGFVNHEKLPTWAEALLAKKGKARLLLDKAEEVLGFDAKKHGLFLEKLNQFRHVPSLLPALLFYEDNRAQGLEKAAAAFEEVPEKLRKENFAFVLMGDNLRLHEKEDVRSALIADFEARQKEKLKPDGKLCSVCGKADHPIVAEPHGMIKNVPAGQSTGCALVSYNESAFESYGLKGNENASVCTACARNYVEGLSHLMRNGVECVPDKGKKYFRYSNRKNLSPDTAMIFWTRNNAPVPELDYVDNTDENAPSILALIMSAPEAAGPPSDDALLLLLDAPFTGREETPAGVDPDLFYSCILSGAAARISTRNWIERAASDVRRNLAAWFHDIAIAEMNFTTKTPQARFFPLRTLANSCGTHRKRGQDGKTSYDLEKEDAYIGRAAAALWGCALRGATPPYSMLDRVLRRIRMEEGRVTTARAALLKFILNRMLHKNPQGGQRMRPQLDKDNTDAAYAAGRIFAVLESIQTAALGSELNAPIRDRFYSAASTNPAATFGRLIKLSQAHLSKLRGEKPGLAVVLDKKLGELFSTITNFPAIFSLEEQGRFAVGYYHQRQDNFTRAGDAENNAVGE